MGASERTQREAESRPASLHAAALTLCDAIYERLRGDDVRGAISALVKGLAAVRARVSPEEWMRIATAVRFHELQSVLLQSPLTRRAFEKPRGYPGDSELMDLIYGLGPARLSLTPLGEQLYAVELDSYGCRSVRERRMRLADEIDSAARGDRRISVLSVACGHLREAEQSVAVRAGRVRLTAVDQDVASLAVVAREYGIFGVTAAVGTVRDIVRRRMPGEPFDLVYAAGLYDYLNPEIATTLTAALFRTLAANGRLLIANFTSRLGDAAYMEACMDWRLIYRDEDQMEALLLRVPSREIARLDQFRDAEGNVTYMRVVRR